MTIFYALLVLLVTMLATTITFLYDLRPQKSLASHQFAGLIFTTTNKSHAPPQILSLGKYMKCMHFSDDMVFSLALVIFQFISDKNQDIYFSISKKRKCLSSLFFIFLEKQDIYFFRGLTI